MQHTRIPIMIIGLILTASLSAPTAAWEQATTDSIASHVETVAEDPAHPPNEGGPNTSAPNSGIPSTPEEGDRVETADEAVADSAKTSGEGSNTAPTSTGDSIGWIKRRVDAASPSIALVTVHGRGGRQIGLGTGFVIAADGLIATNHHVIGEARPIKVKFTGGKEYAVTEVYASDRNLDLAVVRIAAAGLTPLPLASGDDINAGDALIALGNPMGLRDSVVSGVVSGVRQIDGREMIQVAMPIEPGNSGGPLLNRDGRVLGIVTMKSAVTANLGFAINVKSLRSLLDKPNPVAMERWKTIGSLDPEHWEPLFGAQWRRQAGCIAVEGAGLGFGGRSLCISKRKLPEEAFEFGAFVKLDDETGAAGLVFDSNGQDRHYGFYPSAGRIRLTKFEGPSVYNWRVLREFDAPSYERGKWNHLKVRIDGTNLTCFVNDENVLEYELPSAPEGRLGLAKFRDTVAQFRQFTVAPEIGRVRPTQESVESIIQQLSTTTIDEWSSSDAVLPFLKDAQASRFAITARVESLEAQVARLKQLQADVHAAEVAGLMKGEFELPEQEISLARAALLIARLDNRDLDVDAYLKQLDSMAEEIRAKIKSDATPDERVAALHKYLFEDNGYHGSRTNYYHAANSYFDRVIDDREGLPITLSILYLELADAIGVKAQGVGLPGHFVVTVDLEGGSQLIDVFDRGARLSKKEAQRISEGITRRRFAPGYLEPVSKQAIAIRVLQNLLGVARQDRKSEQMLRYLTAMITINEGDASLRGMRAVVRHETGRKQAAIEDLDWIIETAPAEMDMRVIHDLRQRFEKAAVKP